MSKRYLGANRLSKLLRLVTTVALLALVATATMGAASARQSEEKPTLNLSWVDWELCHAVKELLDEYDGATVQMECVPIGEWHDRVFSDFAAGGGADALVLDSQFIGEAVTGGHLVDLTEWLAGAIDVDAYVPTALSAYGEYPAGSGRYYGLPWLADAQVLVYRKDLFAQAGFDPPTSWTELLSQAEAFAAGGAVPYGFTTFWCGDPECYDMIQSVWNQLAWAWGGDLWNPETLQIEGVINSPENVEALRFAARLFATGPSEGAEYVFEDAVAAICEGRVAMTTLWFALVEGLMDASGCAHSADLAFAVVPGEREHVLSLGGQGVHVSAYTDKREQVLDFIEWFHSIEIQERWAQMGGFSARADVLNSESFLNAAPYTRAFAETYPLVKDFWNLPEYNRLLEPQGIYLRRAITEGMDPQEALDEIARRQQAILDEAYPER